MTERPNIIEFVTDPQLLGLSISPAQATLLKSIYGLPLTRDEHDIWHECTGRTAYKAKPFREATIITGARGGKDSRILTPILAYEAVFGGHDQALSRGEHGIIPLVAQDQRATRIAFGYLRSYLTGSALIRSLVEDVLATEIKLTNSLSVICFPCTHASLRGWSNPVGGMDELAFYRLEGQSDSDVEVQASIRRGMLNFPNPKLVKITTPYMKSGVVYADFKNYYGQDNADVLVWRASSILMNPSLKAERLDQERRLDPSRYAREYEAVFADDLAAFLPTAVIDLNVIPHRHELPPVPGIAYTAACDATGGSTSPTADMFTFTVMHTEGMKDQQRIIQDVLKGWKEADLQGIVVEIAICLRRYRISEIRGDKYSGAWIRQAFQREGIRYVDAGHTKSEAYLEAEPLFTQGRLALLDHAQLQRELNLLERRPRPQGRVLVDHPTGGHDDFANVTCLAIAHLAHGSGAWLLFSAGRMISTETVTPGVLARLTSAVKEGVAVVTDQISEAISTTTAAVGQAIARDPSPEEIQRIESLSEGVRTPEEQHLLDVHYQQQHKHRRPNDFEQQVLDDGLFWPADTPMKRLPLEDLNVTMERVRAKFDAWRGR